MEDVFGPVPSRRLGQIQVNDRIPIETCKWNGVFFHLGHSKLHYTKWLEYIPKGD